MAKTIGRGVVRRLYFYVIPIYLLSFLLWKLVLRKGWLESLLSVPLALALGAVAGSFAYAAMDVAADRDGQKGDHSRRQGDS
ncbi:hypothetical protein [Streptomyces sp. NPDC007172]|uniref:hypothetical protein n=1 Tax=unclassified Streptomyces TaxID=2593676 RepID=UPI00367A042F